MEKKTAMKILKELHGKSLFAERTALETLIPELKESEDEEIRKALVRFHKSTIDVDGIKGADILAWLEKQGKPQDKGEISDGYHTFNELYYYRMLYNAAFFNMLPKEWVHKSKRHNDGEECFGGGWFIVMANLPTGQISNHYELKDWDLFQIPEKEVADKWDGHTPQEAADRLHKYLLESQGEQKPFDYEHATITQKDFAPKAEPKKIEQRISDNIPQAFEKYVEHLLSLSDGEGHGSPAKVKEVSAELFKLAKLKQKHAWSEEDEKMYKIALSCIETLEDISNGKNMHADVKDWLKSIKDRIGG